MAFDLEVPRGVAFGFLGPNGAGKTTIIRLLLGLAWPTSGSMSVLGHAVPSDRARALARVGAIVEEPRFYPFLTGRENLEANAAARGGTTATRIRGALERVGLSTRLAGTPDRARARSAPAGLCRHVECGDRFGAGRLGADGEDARLERSPKARPARPRAGRDLRLRERAGRA